MLCGCELVVHVDVVGDAVVLPVIAVAYVEGTVGIFVVGVVAARLTCKGVGVEAIVGVVPHHAVDAHGGVGHVEHFILVILVAPFEDELPVVLPLQPLGSDEVGAHVLLHVVFASVLQYEGLQLLTVVGHTHAVVVHRHRHLLVALVMVELGIGGDTQSHVHQRLSHAKLRHGHHAVVVVLVDDAQPVVAAHLQPLLVVGYGQPVVGVEHGGVQRVLIVLYGCIVEALEPVALKEPFGGRPVWFAVLQMDGEAVIGVRELVEAHVEHVGRAELHHRRLGPLLIDHHLQRLDVWHKNFVGSAYGVAHNHCQC